MDGKHSIRATQSQSWPMAGDDYIQRGSSAIVPRTYNVAAMDTGFLISIQTWRIATNQDLYRPKCKPDYKNVTQFVVNPKLKSKFID